MAKGLLVVESNCADPAREAEFNEWYDKIHLPDMLETLGFISGTRYENAQPGEGKAKFLTICEIEADDIGATVRALNDNMRKKRAEGRFSELGVPVSLSVYRQISSLSR